MSFKTLARLAPWAMCAIPIFGQPRDAAEPLKMLLEQAESNNQELAAMRTRSDEAKGNLRQAGVRLALTIEAGLASGRPLGTVGEEVTRLALPANSKPAASVHGEWMPPRSA